MTDRSKKITYADVCEWVRRESKTESPHRLRSLADLIIKAVQHHEQEADTLEYILQCATATLVARCKQELIPYEQLRKGYEEKIESLQFKNRFYESVVRKVGKEMR